MLFYKKHQAKKQFTYKNDENLDFYSMGKQAVVDYSLLRQSLEQLTNQETLRLSKLQDRERPKNKKLNDWQIQKLKIKHGVTQKK